MLGAIKNFAFLFICFWQWNGDLIQDNMYAGQKSALPLSSIPPS